MQLIFIRVLTNLTPLKDILQNIQIHIYLNRINNIKCIFKLILY